MPVKATVKHDQRIYVSISLDGKGNSPENYNVVKTIEQFTFDNFPSFSGTEEEWEVIKKTATLIEITNLGP